MDKIQIASVQMLACLLYLSWLALVTAKGPCICPLNFAPVCGSDGQTYGNERCMKCANPELRVVRPGVCSQPQAIDEYWLRVGCIPLGETRHHYPLQKLLC
ncbi:unnamed protein product, partial [Iphiclides podalirius]